MHGSNECRSHSVRSFGCPRSSISNLGWISKRLDVHMGSESSTIAIPCKGQVCWPSMQNSKEGWHRRERAKTDWRKINVSIEHTHFELVVGVFWLSTREAKEEEGEVFSMEAVCARGHQKKFSRSKRGRLARIFQHKTALPAPNNRLQRYREARVRISGHFSSTRLHCLTSLVILLLVDMYFCFYEKQNHHSCSSWDHWNLLWKSPQSTWK